MGMSIGVPETCALPWAILQIGSFNGSDVDAPLLPFDLNPKES